MAYKAKLTMGQATEIRRVWREDELSYRTIAKDFGVGFTTIRKVVLNEFYHDPAYEAPSVEELADRRLRILSAVGKKNRHFSEADVYMILKLWHSGKFHLRPLAAMLGTYHSKITNVIYGYRYQEIVAKVRKELGVE